MQFYRSETIWPDHAKTTYVQNKQGYFLASQSMSQHWQFGDKLYFKDGVIYWPTLSPVGMLIKYPDGTKRFINQEL